MAAPLKITEMNRNDIISEIRRHLTTELASIGTGDARSLQLRVIELVKELKVRSSTLEQIKEVDTFKRQISDWSSKLVRPAGAATDAVAAKVLRGEEAVLPAAKRDDRLVLLEENAIKACQNDGFRSVFSYILYSFCLDFSLSTSTSTAADLESFDAITQSLKDLKKHEDNPIKAFRPYLQKWASKSLAKGIFSHNPVLAYAWMLTCNNRGNELFAPLPSPAPPHSCSAARDTLDTAYLERAVIEGSKATIISIQQAHIIRNIIQIIAIPMVRRSVLLSKEALSTLSAAVESNNRFAKESSAEALLRSPLFAHIDDPVKRIALWSHNSLILDMNLRDEERVRTAVDLMWDNLISDYRALESSINLVNEYHDPETTAKRRDAIIHELIRDEPLTILFSREKLLFCINNLKTYIEELRDTRKLLVYAHILRCDDTAGWSDVPRERAVAHLQEYIRLHPEPDFTRLDTETRSVLEAQWMQCQNAHQTADALEFLQETVQMQSDMIDSDYMRSFSTLRALFEMRIIRFKSGAWNLSLPSALKDREFLEETGAVITIPPLAASTPTLKSGPAASSAVGDAGGGASATAASGGAGCAERGVAAREESSVLLAALTRHLAEAYIPIPVTLATSKAAFANGLHYTEMLIHLYARSLDPGMSVETLEQLHLDIETASYYAVEQLITSFALETNSVDNLKNAKLFFDEKGHKLRERFIVSGLTRYRSLRKMPAALRELEGAGIAVLHPYTDAPNKTFVSIRAKLAPLAPAAAAPEETCKQLQAHTLDSLACVFQILEAGRSRKIDDFSPAAALEALRTSHISARHAPSVARVESAPPEEIPSLSALIHGCLAKSAPPAKTEIRRTTLAHYLQRVQYLFQAINQADNLPLLPFYCNQIRILSRHVLEEYICAALEHKGKDFDQMSMKHDLSKLLKDFAFTSSLDAKEMSFIKDSSAQRNNLRYSTKMKHHVKAISTHGPAAPTAAGGGGAGAALSHDEDLEADETGAAGAGSFRMMLSKSDQQSKKDAEEELKIVLNIAAKVAAEAFS